MFRHCQPIQICLARLGILTVKNLNYFTNALVQLCIDTEGNVRYALIIPQERTSTLYCPRIASRRDANFGKHIKQDKELSYT